MTALQGPHYDGSSRTVTGCRPRGENLVLSFSSNPPIPGPGGPHGPANRHLAGGPLGRLYPASLGLLEVSEAQEDSEDSLCLV